MISDHLLDALAEKDLFVLDGWLPETELSELQDDFQDRVSRFRPAGVGRAAEVDPDVRGDKILWWEEGLLSASQKGFWERLEALRLDLNQALYLGLQRFEVHYALYPAGGHYDWHVDNRLGGSSRLITFVFYLNESWKEGDGGELEIHEKNIKIEPRLNRLVVFRSEKVLHRVLVSHKDRKSVTGWFHKRTNFI